MGFAQARGIRLGRSRGIILRYYLKGGASDIARRSRQAILTASILEKLGFKVKRKGDTVTARLQKYECDFVEVKLDEQS